MTEAMQPAGGAAPGGSAGALLREARRAQGLHIAALATAMKVSPHKLEALEADRLDQLPDATFSRALAQAVCRHLKIDPEPVLARLPQNGQNRLDRLGGGLNAPFRDRPGREDPEEGVSWLGSAAIWAPLLLIAGALVLFFVPFELPFGTGATTTASSAPALAPGPGGPAASTPGGPDAAASAASAASLALAGAGVGAASAAAVETPTAAAAPAAAADGLAGNAASASAPTAPVAGVLVVSTSGSSWVQVIDATGRKLLSRELQGGENVGLDGAMPMRITIGDASVTSLRLRGEPVDLAASTRPDRSARLQLP